MQNHQQKGDSSTFIIIPIQNEHNPFLCHHAVLDCRKLATCFPLHFHFSLTLVLCREIILFRHDDVRVHYVIIYLYSNISHYVLEQIKNNVVFIFLRRQTESRISVIENI